MLGKIRQLFRKSIGGFFGRRDHCGAKFIELNLYELYADLNELIARNKIKLAENEDRLCRLEIACKHEEESIQSIEYDIIKRCSLRRIRGLRKRIKNLSRVSVIYNDNLSLQVNLMDRLENIRASGLKTITAEMLNNMVLECEELRQKHRDVISTARAMHYEKVGPEDDMHVLVKEFEIDQ